MDEDMLEHIQQVITTAAQHLRQEIVGALRQEVAGLDLKMDAWATSLRAEMAGMTVEIREEVAAVEARLGERIEETKRHSGILAEDLHHKLELVIGAAGAGRREVIGAWAEVPVVCPTTATIGEIGPAGDAIRRSESSRARVTHAPMKVRTPVGKCRRAHWAALPDGKVKT